MHVRRTPYGLTLIEILITISVLALIAALGFVSYTTLRDNVVLKNQGYELLETLKKAQHRSVISKDGVPHGMEIYADRYILYGGEMSAPIYQETTVLPSGYTLSITPGSPVVFERLTGAAAEASIVLAAPNGETRTITIEATGALRLH